MPQSLIVSSIPPIGVCIQAHLMQPCLSNGSTTEIAETTYSEIEHGCAGILK